MSSVTVRRVETKRDYRTLLHFPWKHYKDNPYWVPPLLSMHRHRLDREHNATWQHMEGDYFIAWQDGEPVGTIAALINHRHNEFWDERIGFFGLFESIDDPVVAHALLETASAWVAGKGYERIRGPVTFSVNDECGLLIEGFDDPPVVLYPYNPPYYPALIESAPGFHKVMDTYAYYITMQGALESPKVQRLQRLVHINSQRRGVVVRSPNLKNLKADLTLLRELYNAAWEKNWGFVPFSDAELDELIKDLGQYLNPHLTLFAEVHGEPAGFLLALPDLNQALKRAYPRPGKPEIITLLQVLWHWKIRSKITRLRVPLMGVKKQFRGVGVEAAMFIELLERGKQFAPKKGWDYADGGWVLETNRPMQSLVEQLNGYVYKRFRFYERELNPSAGEKAD